MVIVLLEETLGIRKPGQYYGRDLSFENILLSHEGASQLTILHSMCITHLTIC